MTEFGVKGPEKGWNAVKQNNQPTNQPSQLNLSNAPTVSLERGNTTPTSVHDMTLNNLMFSLQAWSSRKYGVPFIVIALVIALDWTGSTW